MHIHKHLLVVIGVLLAGLVLVFCWKAFAPTTDIVFPRGGETLVTGETYTLSWNGGPASTHIFLIDTAFEDAGASVSIVYREYGIENKGSHVFTVPARLAEGPYKLQIGNETSKPFAIINPYGYHCGDGTEFTLAPSLAPDELILTPSTNIEPFPKTTLYKKGTRYENGSVRIFPSDRDVLLSTRTATTACKATGKDIFAVSE